MSVGGGSYSLVENVNSGVLTNCIGINQALIYDSVGATLNNCISQNENQFGTNINYAKNCVFKNMNSLNQVGTAKFINCTFSANNTLYQPEKGTFINCTFLNNCFNSIYGTLYNCIVPSGFTKDVLDNAPFWTLKSFDHNQIIGNYYAIMLGGIINTQTISSTPQLGKLTFNPISLTIPVFRDFKILAPANRTIRELITVNKSFSEGIVALQIIDPMNDPLIDSTQTPLAQSTLPDTTNTTLQIGIAYKSSVAKELILRVLAQNGSGTANIDVTRIQQSFQKQNKLI
jgi:hypothetical protein